MEAVNLSFVQTLVPWRLMIGSSAGEDEFARRRDFWFIGELTFFLSSFVSLEPARTHSSWHRWYMRLEFGESLWRSLVTQDHVVHRLQDLGLHEKEYGSG